MQEAKGVWNRNLEYEGIQVKHAQKPSQEIINRLKDAGFRWSRRQQIWYAKELPYRVELLNEIAEYAGETGEKKTFAEKMEAKVERAESRAERYEDLADRTKAKGHQILEDAHKMADIIPLGQPIHGSADRNYRDRIHAKQGRGFETLEKAEYFEHKAEAAEGYEDRTFNTGTTLRRIVKLEANIRSGLLDSDRHIMEWLADMHRFNSGLDNKRWVQLSKKHLEANEKRIPQIQEEIDYWKAEIEKRGAKIWGKDDFNKGDIIITRHGRGQVLKPNKKTVRVHFLDHPESDWIHGSDLEKIPYDELGQNCKVVA